MNFFKKLITKYKESNVVFKASVWFVIVSILDSAISILTQPIVNRILTVEQVGIYNVYNTWATIITIVATFNLFCGVFEVFLVDHKEDRDQVRGSLCVLSTLFTIGFFAIVFIFIKPLSTWLGLKPIYFVLMFVFILAQEIIQFYIVQLRFAYRYIAFTLFVVTLFLFKSVLTILLAYFVTSDRVFGRIIGLIIPMVIAAVVLFILMLRKTSFKQITKYWKKAIIFNLPLIPHYLSSVLLASSDKVMIQQLVGEFSVGIYSVVYSFSSLSLLFFTAINNSYTPWAYTTLKEKRYKELNQTTDIIVFLSIVFCGLLMLMAPEGVYILGGEEYLIALPIVPILICGTFFSSFYFIYANIEFLNKKTQFVFPITLVGTLLNIGLNWLLIPKLGYEIAAYTTLIGYAFIAVAHYVVSRIIAKEKVFDIKITCLLLLALGGMTVGSIFIYKVAFWIRYILVALFLVLFIVFVIFYMKKRKEKAMVAISESASENENVDEKEIVNENENGEENESSDNRAI